MGLSGLRVNPEQAPAFSTHKPETAYEYCETPALMASMSVEGLTKIAQRRRSRGVDITLEGEALHPKITLSIPLRGD
jgi:hypothetical protein